MTEAEIERVARAIYDTVDHSDELFYFAEWESAARAAIAAMPGWRPIETAVKEPERKIWLAHFRPGEPSPMYIVQAEWGTAMPGHIQCASYSGWFIDPPIVSDPGRYRGSRCEHGIVSMTDLPPTHWREPLPAPQESETAR